VAWKNCTRSAGATALRLKVGEVGVVKADFGIHIIQRVE
jgi:hypothetical protein